MRPERLVPTVEDVKRPQVAVLPDPAPIQTAKVKWYVLTPDTIPEGDFVFFAVDEAGYEAVATNQSEVLRWIKEARYRLIYYREKLGGTDD